MIYARIVVDDGVMVVAISVFFWGGKAWPEILSHA
jgi:hypothetical protein